MTTYRIRVSCPVCSTDAELAPADLRLSVCSLLAGLSSYMWHCDPCGTYVRRHANRDTIDLLVQAGVTARPHPKPPRTEQQIIDDFIAELDAMDTAPDRLYRNPQ